MVLNNIESGIINIEYIHGDFRVVAANSMICRLCGLTENEFTDMDEQTFILMASEKDRDALGEMLICLKDSSCKHELEYRIRSELAGEHCWLYAIGNSIQMQDDVISVFITFYDISSTKEQEKIFQSNQKAVRLAQKRGNIAIWTYNIDEKTIIQQSPTDEVGNMGYPVCINNVPQTFIASKSIYPDDEKIFLDAYKKLDDNEESVDAVYRIMNNDTGKYDWVHMYYQRIYDNNLHRTALGFSVLVNRQQNQMEQYRTELQLRKQIFAKADLAVEVDLTQGIVIEMTGGMFTNTDVKYWNGKDFSEYYQYVYELVENEYKSEIEKLSAHNLLEMFQSGETRNTIEFWGRGTKDSPLLYYRSSAYITSNPFNGHVNAFIYTENVDDEVKYKQAIESSLDDGIESIGLIRVSDGVSRLIKTSRLMKCYEEGMTFVYDDDFVIQSCKDVSSEERDSYIKLGKLSTVIQELSHNNRYEYKISLSEESIGVRKMLFQYKYLDKQKKEIVFSMWDITGIYEEEQKKSLQLKKALDDAKRANDVTNQFMARMSHDMRTPMNGILGVAELSKDTNDSDELKRNIAIIEDSGKYLLSLINDTLDYQKIQSGKLSLTPTIVDVGKIINNVVAMIKATAEKKGVKFELKLNTVDSNWFIRMDEIRLKQIFINLLSNAIKFTPLGGKVEWELKLLSREGMISHDVLIVRDTGAGMSKEFMKNGIFKPFSQEYNNFSNQYAGSGLGLSIVKNLVELMGGHIEVESELGEGSEFKVFLDFERIEKISSTKLIERDESESNILKQLVGMHVLLVEDHPLNAEIAKRILEKAGCIVSWASDGQKGIDEFKASRVNQYDAILMDIRMPLVDGLEATRIIRALDRPDATAVPIIAMTANAFDNDVRNCLEAGMNAHIGKPVEPKILYQTLAEYR